MSKTEERQFIVGQDRNEPNAVAHIYEGTFSDPGNPMCLRGWNREESYSIFRNVNTGGTCKVCERRVLANKPSVEWRERKTKWL